MKTHNLQKSAMVAAVTLIISGISFAQSPSLTMPNNSAGTVEGIPGATVITNPAPIPSVTESSVTAFEKLDAQQRGYVTRGDIDRLSGTVNFDSADRNHDGRLDSDEFQRAWAEQGSGGQ